MHCIQMLPACWSHLQPGVLSTHRRGYPVSQRLHVVEGFVPSASRMGMGSDGLLVWLFSLEGGPYHTVSQVSLLGFGMALILLLNPTAGLKSHQLFDPALCSCDRTPNHACATQDWQISRPCVLHRQ